MPGVEELFGNAWCRDNNGDDDDDDDDDDDNNATCYCISFK